MTTVMYTKSSTFNVLSRRLVIDMDPVIHLLEPDVAPLTVLLSKLKKGTAENTRFDWLEDM